MIFAKGAHFGHFSLFPLALYNLQALHAQVSGPQVPDLPNSSPFPCPCPPPPVFCLLAGGGPSPSCNLLCVGAITLPLTLFSPPSEYPKTHTSRPSDTFSLILRPWDLNSHLEVQGTQTRPRKVWQNTRGMHAVTSEFGERLFISHANPNLQVISPGIQHMEMIHFQTNPSSHPFRMHQSAQTRPSVGSADLSLGIIQIRTRAHCLLEFISRLHPEGDRFSFSAQCDKAHMSYSFSHNHQSSQPPKLGFVCQTNQNLHVRHRNTHQTTKS